MTRSVLLPVAVVAAVLCGFVPSAGAVPLDAAACSGLDKERTALETSGVLGDLHLSADAAKALAKDRLDRVEHYVDISGQLLFRCQSIAIPVHATAKSASVTPAAKPAVAAKPTGRRSVLLRRRH